MRLKRKILLAVLVVIALLILWPVMSHRQARRVLDDYRAELVTRGEKLSPKELAPHFTADEQSMARDLVAAFAIAPSMTSSTYAIMGIKILSPGHSLVSWSQEILPNIDCSNAWLPLHETIQTHTNTLHSLRMILDQPIGGLNLDYSQGAMLMLSHLAQDKRAAVWLCEAANLDLHEGRTAQACEDLKTCMDLSHFCEHEPLMISQLVRVAILAIAIGSTWEELQSPNLNERELVELQKCWETAHPLSCATRSLEMERAMLKENFDALRSGQMSFNAMYGSGTPPSTTNFIQDVLNDPGKEADEAAQQFKFWVWKWRWSYDEELMSMQELQGGIETARKIQSNAPFVVTLKSYDTAADKIRAPYTNMIGKFFLGLDPGYLHNYLRKLCLIEAQRKLAITAIALKRFQVAHQKFPADLKELTPSYLASIPIDPMDGKPLRYRPNSDGTFLLYSVGEDGVDDGGDSTIPKSVQPPQVVSNQNSNWTSRRDMVWPVPATTQESEAYVKSELDAWRSKQAKANSDRRTNTTTAQPAATGKTN
jgi:hypothetical protein